MSFSFLYPADKQKDTDAGGSRTSAVTAEESQKEIDNLFNGASTKLVQKMLNELNRIPMILQWENSSYLITPPLCSLLVISCTFHGIFAFFFIDICNGVRIK